MSHEVGDIPLEDLGLRCTCIELDLHKTKSGNTPGCCCFHMSSACGKRQDTRTGLVLVTLFNRGRLDGTQITSTLHSQGLAWRQWQEPLLSFASLYSCRRCSHSQGPPSLSFRVQSLVSRLWSSRCLSQRDEQCPAASPRQPTQRLVPGLTGRGGGWPEGMGIGQSYDRRRESADRIAEEVEERVAYVRLGPFPSLDLAQ